METKKMKNAANFFSSLAKFGKTFALVMACVCGVFAILLLIFGKGMVSNFYLELGDLSIYFKDNHSFNENLMITQTAVELFISVLICLAVSYACKTLYEVIEPMKEGRPFEESTAKGLKKLAWTSLVIGGLGEIINLVGSIFTGVIFNFEELFGSLSWVDSVTYEYEMDLSFIFIFCIFMFLSHVFQYGQKLQQESDETL